MAHGATSTSATEIQRLDIARGMGPGPVNPLTASSVMGRGVDHDEIGESPHHRLNEGIDIGHLKDKT